MPRRRLLARATPCALSLLVAAALCGRLFCPLPPADSGGLAGRARAQGLYVYPLSPLVCFVTDSVRETDDLQHLPYDRTDDPRWKGVAYCQLSGQGDGVPAGPWRLHGDAAMIERLRAIIGR